MLVHCIRLLVGLMADETYSTTCGGRSAEHVYTNDALKGNERAAWQRLGTCAPSVSSLSLWAYVCLSSAFIGPILSVILAHPGGATLGQRGPAAMTISGGGWGKVRRRIGRGCRGLVVPLRVRKTSAETAECKDSVVASELVWRAWQCLAVFSWARLLRVPPFEFASS